MATASASADFNGDGFIDLVATNDGFPEFFEGSTVSAGRRSSRSRQERYNE